MKDINHINCSFLRRLAAILYDSILLSSIFFFATFILVISLGDGEIDSGNIFYTVFLISLAYFYFCWHWIKGRQTLGMRSWKIQVVNESNDSLHFKQASIRFITSLLSLMLLGLGFIWALFDKDKYALHDRLSKTKLIVQKNN